MALQKFTILLATTKQIVPKHTNLTPNKIMDSPKQKVVRGQMYTKHYHSTLCEIAQWVYTVLAMWFSL